MANNGLNDLMRAFDKIPQEVRKDIEPAIEQGADELVARMKYLAPVEKGDLQKSIVKENTGVPLSKRVAAGGALTTKKVRQSEKGNAPDFDYALGTEYGTVDTPKQSFFWPAVNTLKRRVRRRIDRAIRKAMERAWK